MNQTVIIVPARYTFSYTRDVDGAPCSHGTLDVEPARTRSIFVRKSRLNIQTPPLVVSGVCHPGSSYINVGVAFIANPDVPFVPKRASVIPICESLCVGENTQLRVNRGEVTAAEALWMTVFTHAPRYLYTLPPHPKIYLYDFLSGKNLFERRACTWTWTPR